MVPSSGTRLALLGLLASAAACVRSKAEHDAAPAARQSEELPESEHGAEINPALSSALQRVRAEDPETRSAAGREVRELLEKRASIADVSAVIETASSGDLPPPELAFQSADGNLLRTVWGKTTDEHVAMVDSRFDAFSTAGRSDALALLAQTETKTSAEAYVKLLRDHGWPEQSWPAMTVAFEQKALFPEVILPALLDGSIDGMPEEVIDRLLLGYGSAGKLPENIQDAARARTVRRARERLAVLAPLQKSDGVGWRWDEGYVELRTHAGLVLDVLGHLGRSDDSVAALRQAESLEDPRVGLFAVLSLLELGETPAPESLRDVAGDPESRGHLFRRLQSSNALDLMPSSERTQEKLAEADMVAWLTYPTELGRAPDQIELMNTAEVDAGADGGVFVYYVFRFRTHEPHWSAKDGWMAGISGPFRKEDMPTMDGWGETFSAFTKWDEFDASQHLSSVRQLMDAWRKQQ